MAGLRELTWGRRKDVDEAIAGADEEGFKLKRELGALDVTVLGIGVIIGAGIFVLTGQAAAEEAGPGIALSFVLAGVICVFAALCYAEFAAMVPVAGSAYTFSYATLGELVAFVIGWDLALEFIVGASAVSVGWSAYLNATLDQIFGVTLPASISGPPSAEGGFINLPAIAIVALVAFLLIRGIRITAKANIVITAIIVAVVLLVIVVGGTEVDQDNWSPFLPFGWDGIVGGAAVVFFAYIGFDIVATTAEETRNPQRDMPIGIIASLAVVTVLYVLVALVITGMRPYEELASAAPVADAFELLDKPWIASIVYVGALLALTNTVLILMLGQTRVGFAMARDRLFPPALAKTHPRYGTPWRFTLLIAVADLDPRRLHEHRHAGRPGEHRDAVRVHPRGDRDHAAAARRPRPAPAVPDAARAVHPDPGDRALDLADGHARPHHLVPLHRLDGARPDRVLRLLAPAQPARLSPSRRGADHQLRLGAPERGRLLAGDRRQQRGRGGLAELRVVDPHARQRRRGERGHGESSKPVSDSSSGTEIPRSRAAASPAAASMSLPNTIAPGRSGASSSGSAPPYATGPGSSPAAASVSRQTASRACTCSSCGAPPTNPIRSCPSAIRCSVTLAIPCACSVSTQGNGHGDTGWPATTAGSPAAASRSKRGSSSSTSQSRKPSTRPEAARRS